MEEEKAGPSCRMAKLRVAGAWSGVIEVPLEEWTVRELRAELGRRSGFPVDSINLITAGRILKDQCATSSSSAGSQLTLKGLGLGTSSKLLMTCIGGDQTIALNKEKERCERLTRIKAAVDAMAKRSNEDSFPSDDFDIQLENQSGKQLKFDSDDDRRALVMGLMLHAKARNLIQQSQYIEALEVLAMAEESFSLCDKKILEVVDNVALLQIDTVWCLFMLRDIGRLAVAQERLAHAREGLCRSHGRSLERLRVLQGGFCPELALYVRLELLEGVVAYHSGHSESAQRSLVSAYGKYQQLQVSDEAVALLAGMGFPLKESRRALRVSGQDVQRAVEFVMEERKKKLEQSELDRQHRLDRREQKKFGKTPSGKAVDIGKLNELASIGYERRVAGEALRQSENDIQAALDVLSDPTTFSALQVFMRTTPTEQVNYSVLTELVAMGFDRGRAMKAARGCESSSEAIERLLQENLSPAAAPSAGGQENLSHPAEAGAEAAAASTGGQGQEQEAVATEQEEKEREARDDEMEEEIAGHLTGDSLAEYDLEVDMEGSAILEYLSLMSAHPTAV